MTTSDTFTLWDGSEFFTLDGARRYAKFARDLGVSSVEIVITLDGDLELVGLQLGYVERTGRGTRTRRTSTHVANPAAFSVWAEMTEVA